MRVVLNIYEVPDIFFHFVSENSGMTDFFVSFDEAYAYTNYHNANIQSNRITRKTAKITRVQLGNSLVYSNLV